MTERETEDDPGWHDDGGFRQGAEGHGEEPVLERDEHRDVEDVAGVGVGCERAHPARAVPQLPAGNEEADRQSRADERLEQAGVEAVHRDAARRRRPRTREQSGPDPDAEPAPAGRRGQAVEPAATPRQDTDDEEAHGLWQMGRLAPDEAEESGPRVHRIPQAHGPADDPEPDGVERDRGVARWWSAGGCVARAELAPEGVEKAVEEQMLEEPEMAEMSIRP